MIVNHNENGNDCDDNEEKEEKEEEEEEVKEDSPCLPWFTTEKHIATIKLDVLCGSLLVPYSLLCSVVVSV